MSLPPHLPAYQAPRADRVQSLLTSTSWMIKDPERFHALMKEAASLVQGGVHLGDNLFTWCRNLSMLDDAAFRQAWEANIANEADRAIAWRRYFLATMAHHAVQLEGDFVECGVYAGTGVKTVMDYLGGRDFPRTFWGFDTFDYNPVPGHAFEGQAPGFHAGVVARFAGYPQARMVMGLIPEVFATACPGSIAYLHIDLNNAAAEIAALEHLFDRVVAGGVVIFDDYEWAGVYRPQKLAIDAWLHPRGYRVAPLPTGQGFLIRR